MRASLPGELRLTVPADSRFAGMVRDLAAQCARASGRPEAAAAAFGRTVEHAAREAVDAAPRGAMVVVVVRAADVPEVVLDAGRGPHTVMMEP